MTDPESLPSTDREPNLCPFCDQPEIGQHVCPPSRAEIAFMRRSPAGLVALRRLKEGAR